MKATFLLSLLITTLCLLGCRKDLITSDPSTKLEFSTDSIFFDTVFTSTGSVTQRIKVFNRGKKAVRINEIKLYGGTSSHYQININGQAAHYLQNIELRGSDSLNVFVKVTINPNSELTPFIVTDSIGFLTNGNQQQVILQAYGQNAVFVNDEAINTDEVWDNELPYVLYKAIKVNPAASLTIKKGAKLYFHKDAEMIIAGTLKVEGELNKPVLFSSDRLEQIYENEPGQWKGLHFLSSSKNNLINYAVIKNGTIGIRVDSLSENSGPKLLLANSMLYNMELVGLYGYQAEIAGFNNVIANCGKHLIYGINGGHYNLKQNTFVNLGIQFARNTPGLFFSNQADEHTRSAFNLTLINNIIWGNLQDELIVEKKGTLPFSQVIRNNLIKTRDATLEGFGNFINENPQFKTIRVNTYTLSTGSPAGNKGEDLSEDTYFNDWLNKDLNGRGRVFPSDLGSYEIF